MAGAAGCGVGFSLRGDCCGSAAGFVEFVFVGVTAGAGVVAGVAVAAAGTVAAVTIGWAAAVVELLLPLLKTK